MTLTAVHAETHATTDWQPVCPLEALEPLWAEAALVDREQVAVVRLPSDEVVAVSHWDPYAKAHVMARGIVGSRGGRPTLTSPLHKQVYDLATGECLTDPALRLATFPVRVRDGIVAVGRHEQAAW
ncbi:nitrite reductase small subunit NirD [Citricoccus muralis]|uniref:Assimilatory nitrite reductase (NAD(P)H) small subunit n=1 Tax=Citricoccus muralis TaxID=169134 RepID=A0A3D9LDH3_9MICC|nr:nitrite reductase small subunit NirD [Citricoccus muralis]REE03920.1 assimilatory nitrite reductase (NAD(P)H) small subunit [Citricoccus muralis]